MGIRILLDKVRALDAKRNTCFVRELEMAVDSIVTFEPAYATQFFTDCRLYGIDEAKAYLLKFIEKNYQSPEDLSQDVVGLCKIIERIHNAIGTGVKISNI